MQRVEHFLVIEIAGHFKRRHALRGGVGLHAGHGAERFVHSLDAFASAKMHAFEFQRPNFFTLRAGAGIHLDARLAALAEVAGGHERVGGFLNGGRISGRQRHGRGVLIHGDGRARDFAHGFLHALHAGRAAEVDIADFDGDIGGMR